MAARQLAVRSPRAAVVPGGPGSAVSPPRQPQLPGGRLVVRRPGHAPVRMVASESELSKRRLTGLRVARSKVAAIQRTRILAATVRAVDELGYADTSVAEIVARSRVSRRTFYELFANREECLAAVLGDTAARLEDELERAGLAQLEWREQVRTGLWAILAFLDRELVLARVCVVGSLGGGEEVLAWRETVLARLAGVVDEGRSQSDRGVDCTHLTAEGLVGAAYAIVYSRLVRAEQPPLTELLGELMATIVLPYLGPGAARRERSRPAPTIAATAEEASERRVFPIPDEDPLQGLKLRLTYRTMRVLEGVRECPGASNRQVADLAGIADPGQVSKLLRRLERLGLLENQSGGHAQGEPNQWRLTEKGQRVTQGIRAHTTTEEGTR